MQYDVTPTERCALPSAHPTDGGVGRVHRDNRENLKDCRDIRASRAFRIRTASAAYHVPPSKREPRAFFPLSPDLETPTEVLFKKTS